MPRIAPVDLATAPSGVQATLAAVKAKIGMVPNLFKTLGRAPAALNGYIALSDALGGGVLTPKQREIVALAVGQANGCGYCLSAHSLMGKGAGLTPDAIMAARRGAGADAADHAIAALALRVVETRGRVSDADLASARLAGLTDGHVIEVVAQVALNTLTNFTNNLAGTDIDFPKVDVALAA